MLSEIAINVMIHKLVVDCIGSLSGRVELGRSVRALSLRCKVIISAH
jgi:hypothetical protein